MNLVQTGDSNMDAVLKYTKMCDFFLKGKCQRGARCNFAHNKDQLQSKPDLFKTVLCVRFMSKGACKSGQSCRFAHCRDELRQVREVDESSQCSKEDRQKQSFMRPVPAVPRQALTPGKAPSVEQTIRNNKREGLLMPNLTVLDDVMAELRPFISVKNSFLNICAPQTLHVQRSASVPANGRLI